MGTCVPHEAAFFIDTRNGYWSDFNHHEEYLRETENFQFNLQAINSTSLQLADTFKVQLDLNKRIWTKFDLWLGIYWKIQ